MLTRVRAAGPYHNAFRDEIMALEHLANSQYHLGNSLGAENSLKASISLISGAKGERDPKVIANMTLLENWLRHWGRDAEADDIKAQINVLTAQDEVDENVAELLQQT